MEGVRYRSRVIFLGKCLLLAASATWAQGPSVPIIAHMSLEKGVITQHEPVILEMVFDNSSPRGVVVNLGYEDEKIDVKVVDPQGREFYKPRSVVRSGWRAADVFSVSSGAASPGSVVLNDWFNFDKVGAYRIEVTLAATSSAKEPFSYTISSNSAILDLTVLPRDEHSLESTCADLLARTLDLHSSAGALTAAKALSEVNDPVVVRFLAVALKSNEFKGLMVEALARLKTKEAIDALIVASRSADPETRDLARSALTSIGAP